MNFEHIITTPDIFNTMKNIELVELKCTICLENYTRTKKQVLRSFKTRENANMFCSSSCQGAKRSEDNTQKFECFNCNAKILKTNAEVKKSKTNRFFCNSSCAASYNNKCTPKRIKERICNKCEEFVHSDLLCKNHYNEYMNQVDTNKASLKENSSPSRIRSFNRTWNQDLILQGCLKCNYSRHVELAHIKAIKDFNSQATLGEINNKNNVIPLCPTCHWEFDNGYREEFIKVVENYFKTLVEAESK